jgi:hypothetical protein
MMCIDPSYGKARGLVRAATTRGAGAHAILAAWIVLALSLSPAWATDLLYSLQSPSFGGANNAAETNAQTAAGLKAQQAANAAAAKATTTSDPNAAFVSAITSQLTGLVAESIAQKIANSTNGQAGTIQSGGVSITYVNSDGELNVTITTPTGTTNLQIPVSGPS